jgi:hypothetical protein
MKKLVLFTFILITISFSSCTDIDDTQQETFLLVKFKFDGSQVRLNNFGQPSFVPTGHAAQTPTFNSISAHYLELAKDQLTQLSDGEVLYHAPETIAGGNNAIDFAQSIVVAEGETFLKIPLKSVKSGSYQFMRVSLSYQNFQINVRYQGLDRVGTLSSFVGFNTYLNNNTLFPVAGNKLQGYWEFIMNDNLYSTSGQAPVNATTVPNPIAATSPIPAGSCVVTGKFETPLEITGLEKKNITITLSLSTNKSFEWIENSNNNKFDPNLGDIVVDMGLRGLIPSYVK